MARPRGGALAGVLAAGALLVAAAPAEAPAPLDWLHGRWTGAGAVRGVPSKATLEVAPALGGRFTELRYAFVTEGAQPLRFEGRGYYRPDGRGWNGQWFDSTGAQRRLAGTVEGTMLSTNWGDPASERGRTTYRLEGGAALEVTDAVLDKDGNWRVFGHHRFTRQ